MNARQAHTTLLLMAVSALLLLFASCDSGGSSEIDKALELAGENRGELEAVLTHYTNEGDTLKLQAAEYLIANMEGHCYVTYKLVDTAGAEVEFDALAFPDYDSLLTVCSAIEQERGELDYERKDKVEDLETITADFLIEQIDLAFRAWNEKPWAKGMPFDRFCQYVLPYRGSNEPLEPWRQKFFDDYADLDSTITDPVKAASAINKDVRSWFGFDRRFYLHPTDQGLSEMMVNKLGRCEDMTNITIYALRANGLAVTSDYTPYWANSGNNHAWNAIVTADGTVIPFMGAEADPGEYSLYNKVGKVYRKTFGKQWDNLAFVEHKQEKVPRWLAGKNYQDVTASYVDAVDVTVEFEQEIPDTVDIAYLCVFNSGEWKAIHWARVENGKAVFSDMGPDVMYLPALYLNEEVVPFGTPFLLVGTNETVELKCNPETTGALQLAATTKPRQAKSTDSVEKSYLKNDQEYELFYWSDGWQSAGKSVAGKKPLQFSDVPKGGLYWLVEDGSDREERIFTIENGEQIWW